MTSTSRIESELDDLWEHAQWKMRGMAVFFEYAEVQNLRSSVSRIARGATAFYAGATTSPAWRWEGGATMKGHGETYDQMHVIHVADSYSARNREKVIIEHGMLTYPMTCLNKVADARGQVKAHNFLYVVVKF